MLIHFFSASIFFIYFPFCVSVVNKTSSSSLGVIYSLDIMGVAGCFMILMLKSEQFHFLWLDTLPGYYLVTGCTGCYRVFDDFAGEVKAISFFVVGYPSSD